MLKAVIFDFDGTIGDTLALCVEAFKTIIEPLAGHSFTDQEILATFGPSEEGTIRNLVPQKAEEGLAAYLREYEERHEKYPNPFPGMRELLNELRDRGLILALVTGKGEKTCEISLARYNMTGVFEQIECGSPEGPCKLKGINAVLNRYGLDPSEAIYVGDAPSDIDASHDAGIAVVAAAWASTADVAGQKERHPDYLCLTIDELRNLLTRL